MIYTREISCTADTGSDFEQSAPEAEVVIDNSRTTPSGSYLPFRDGIVRRDALQAAAAGVFNGVSPLNLMDSINSASEQLGNRAFLHWVGALHAQNPNLPLTKTAPLQFGRKKHKKKGVEPEAGDTPPTPLETVPQAGTASVPEPAATLTETQPRATDLTGEKKKKKKSRVQVALNTLRSEGVEAFVDYIGTEIGEPELLHSLVVRMIRAQDLGGVRDVALGIVEARLRVLGPEYAPTMAQAANPGQDADIAVIAREKTLLNTREIEVFKCCYSGNAGKLRNLLKFGKFEINIMFVKGTPLCYAAYLGLTAVARELLSVPGIEVNLGQSSGATPLYLAAQQGHVEIVKILLAVPGIKINLASLEQTTPLCIAAQHGREEVARLLLKKPGIRINVQQYDGATALFCASQDNYPGIVDQLVKHGANVNLQLDDGSSPLCVAATKGNVEVVRLLLRAPDIQVDCATHKGATALGLACQLGHKEIVRMLLGMKADVNFRSSTGLTPLHAACLWGQTAIVEMLLHAKADMNAEISATERYTPYSLAQLMDYRSVMTLIQAYEKSISAQPTLPGRLSPQDESEWSTPPSTPPPEWFAQTTNLLAAQPGEPAPLPTVSLDNPGTGVVAQAETGSATDAAESPSPAAPGSQSTRAETPSPLSQAKDALRQDVLGKLRDDNLEPLEGIRLLEDVNASPDIDRLCALYNRLAHMERQQERARRRRQHRGGVIAVGVEVVPAVTTAPRFALGEKPDLDADAVEDEIKLHLDQSRHRFVSQVVNGMEFGRGKLTTGYPGLLHVSAGIPWVGSCSVFYYTDAERNLNRIVGIGYHLDRGSYRLEYAAGELRDIERTLRIA